MRRCIYKDASRNLRETSDETLSLALSLRKSSLLAFHAFNIFVFFPRLLLPPSPPGRLLGRLHGGVLQQEVPVAERDGHSHPLVVTVETFKTSDLYHYGHGLSLYVYLFDHVTRTVDWSENP